MARLGLAIKLLGEIGGQGEAKGRHDRNQQASVTADFADQMAERWPISFVSIAYRCRGACVFADRAGLPHHVLQRGRWWIPSQIYQFLPFQKAVAVVETQDSDRDLTNSRERFDDNSIELKVIGPTISTWVKEPTKLACLRYDRPNITPLLAITKGTGIRQVSCCCRTAVLHTDDVIYLTSEVGIVLVNEAILTQILSALGNQFPKVVADIATHE